MNIQWLCWCRWLFYKKRNPTFRLRSNGWTTDWIRRKASTTQSEHFPVSQTLAYPRDERDQFAHRLRVKTVHLWLICFTACFTSCDLSQKLILQWFTMLWATVNCTLYVLSHSRCGGLQIRKYSLSIGPCSSPMVTCTYPTTFQNACHLQWSWPNSISCQWPHAPFILHYLWNIQESLHIYVMRKLRLWSPKGLCLHKIKYSDIL